MSALKKIRIKRAYEEVTDGDGLRVLVDRLWPRGIKKEVAGIDEWIKTLAPTKELRQWFGHDPDKWQEFRTRYMQELDARKDAVEDVLALCRKQAVTLVFSARDTAHNNAVVLKEYLERHND